MQHGMGDGAIEYLTSSIYDWTLFVMSFFGIAPAVDESNTGEVRKQRVVEAAVFVIALFLYLYVSIFL